ncbi:MAG: RCC1 domain-containing protein [Sandaracinaceae bacterium]
MRKVVAFRVCVVAALLLVSVGCGSRTGLLDLDPLATPAPPTLRDASVPGDAGVDAGDAGDADVEPPSPPIEDLDPVRTVSAGLFHTCVATRSGRTLCWGFNNLGQLGDGSNDNRTVPVPTVGITDAVSVTAGRSHSCALLEDGSVRCWGNNTSGELGSGTPESRHLSPVQVDGFEFDEAILEISAGGEHTCGASESGLVFCWGSNDNGQVGPDARGSYREPVWVRGVEERRFNVAAGFEHTCVLGPAGVECWGEAAIERTRPPPDDEIAPPFVPTAVPGLPTSVSFLDSGDFMSCAVDRPAGVSDRRGDVWCWGFERGDDDIVRPTSARRVNGIEDAEEVSVGHEFACARTTAGEVRCWGNNERGQLGDGGDQTNPTVPVTPEGLPRTVQVTAGWRHACALDDAGVVRCWGRNQEGQLGDGRGGEYRLPTIAAVIRE